MKISFGKRLLLSGFIFYFIVFPVLPVLASEVAVPDVQQPAVVEPLVVVPPQGVVTSTPEVATSSSAGVDILEELPAVKSETIPEVSLKEKVGELLQETKETLNDVIETILPIEKEITLPLLTPEQVSEKDFQVVDETTDVAYLGAGKKLYRIYDAPRSLDVGDFGLEVRSRKQNFFDEVKGLKFEEKKMAGYKFSLPVKDLSPLEIKSGNLEISGRLKVKKKPQFSHVKQFEKDGATITDFAGIYPQTTVRFVDREMFRQKNIIITERPKDLMKSDVLTFWEEYTLSPGSKVFDSQNHLLSKSTLLKNAGVVIQAADNSLFSISAPLVFDSGSGDTSVQDLYQIVQVDYAKRKLSIGIQLNAGYLLEEKRIYPVTIDPTYYACGPNSANSNGNALNCTLGGITDLYLRYLIGRDTASSDLFVGYYSAPDGPASRTIVTKFGLNIPAGQSIDLALLRLTYNRAGSGNFNGNVALIAKKITTWWNPNNRTDDVNAITYTNIRNGLVPVGLSANISSATAGGTQYSFNVTSAVSDWYRDASTNHGVAVEPVPAWLAGATPPWSNRLFIFNSSRNASNQKPHLEVVTRDIRPDLINRAGPTINQQQFQPGQQIIFQNIVQNVGGGASAAAGKVYYFLKKDGADYTNAYKIGENAFGVINAGAQTGQLELRYNIPAGTVPGRYYLSYWADAQNMVAEADETNNKNFIIIDVVAPQLPDLVGQNVTLNDNTVYAGDTVDLRVTVANTANVATPRSGYVQYYFNPNAARYDSTPVDEDFFDVLAAGGSSAERTSFTIPVDTPPGRYYLSYWIDARNGGQIAESNENNNQGAVQITVEVRPDPLEANNAWDTAFSLDNSLNYSNNQLTLAPGDEDWFKFQYNNEWYYFKVRGYGANTSGSYGLNFTRSGRTLTLETFQVSGNTDTVLHLYGTDHSSELASNDDSQGLFSRIVFELPFVGYCDGLCGGGGGGAPPATNQLPDTDDDSFADVEEKFGGTNMYGAQSVSLYDQVSKQKLATTVDQKSQVYGADPVNVRTGGFEFTQTDFLLKGRGIPLDITRTYNSLVVDKNNRIGNGWNLSYNMYYYQDSVSHNVLVYLGGTLAALFTTPDNGATFISPPGVDDKLFLDGQNFVYQTLTGVKYVFSQRLTSNLGMVDRIIDRNGNSTMFSYNFMREVPLLSHIVDASGRRIDFVYGAAETPLWDKIIQIQETFQQQNPRQIHYEYDGNGNLIRVQENRVFGAQSESIEKQFMYDASGRMTSYRDPRGTILYNTYDDQGRVIAQREFNPRVDAVGSSRLVYELQYMSGVYAPAPTSVACTLVKNYRDVNIFYTERTCFDASGLSVLKENGEGKITQSSYNVDGMPVLVTDGNGNRFQYQYDNRRRLTREILPDTLAFHTERIFSYENTFNQLTEKTENMSRRDTGVVVTRRTQFTIDPQNGNIREMIDALGNREVFGYDQFGNVVSFTDRAGNVRTYSYDQNGNYRIRESQTLTQADGSQQTLTKEYTHDSHGNQISLRTGRGNVYQFQYDNHDNLRLQTDPAQNTRQFVYDVENNKIQETNELGQVTNFVYDTDIEASLLSVEKVGSNGNIITRQTYDFIGNLLTDVDARGMVTRYEYDRANQVVGIQNPIQQFTYAYDFSGNKIRSLNNLGQRVDFLYNERNERIGLRSFINANDFVETRYEIDGFGRKTSVTNPNGQVTRFEYDLLDHVLSETNPLGAITRYTYDALGQKRSKISPRAGVDETVRNRFGQSETFVYDAAGRISKYIDALNQETHTFYDEENNISRIVLSMNSDGSNNTHVTSYSYDSLNRKIRENNALGGVRTYTYDAGSQLTGVTDEMNRTTGFGYDDFGRKTRITDPSGNITRFVFDQNGNQTRVTSPDNTFISFSYDALNRLTEKVDQNNGRKNFVYDSVGNKTQETNALGARINYRYDNLNRLVAETNSQGTETLYTYDGLGNRLTERTGMAQRSYVYDNANRLTRLTDYGNKTEEYQYDINGNRIEHIDGNANHTIFVYDALDRVIQKQLPGNQNVRYGYDNWNNIITLHEPAQSTTSTYDLLNHVTSERKVINEIPNQPLVVRRTYHADGQLATLEDASQKVMNYSYNDGGLLQSVSYQNTPLLTYSYNALNEPTNLAYRNGLSVQYTYDTLGRAVSFELQNQNHQALLRHVYNYDAESNRTRLQETSTLFGRNVNKTVDYAYDDQGQLVSVDYSTIPGARNMAFTYDAFGNRTSVTLPTGDFQSLYNAESQELTSYTLGHLRVDQTYDGNGSLSREIFTRLGQPLRTVNYLWDTQNRLSEIRYAPSEPAFLGGQVSTVLQFVSDDAGNRIKKSINNEPARTVYSLNQGLTVLNELNNTGVVQKTVVQGIHQIAEIDANGQITFTHTDVLGSPVALSNEAGEVVAEYEYDPFGNVVGSDGTADTRYKFTGQEHDSESDLYYYNARYYNPVLGRFLSRDASLGTTGNILSRNPYIYTQNNPLKYTDPSGNFLETFWDIGNVIYDVGQTTWGLGQMGYAWVTDDSEIMERGKSNASEGAVSLTLDAAATLVPFVPAGITKVVKYSDEAIGVVKGVDKVKDAVKTVDKVGDGVKNLDTVNDIQKNTKRWEVGDPINQNTQAGNYPSWQTVRQRYWKNEAASDSNKYSSEYLDLMKKGKAPLDQKGIPLELDHIKGRNIPDPHNPNNLRPLTKDDHILRHRIDGKTNLDKTPNPNVNYMIIGTGGTLGVQQTIKDNK